MGKCRDLTNETFEWLKIIGRAEIDGNDEPITPKSLWWAECKCGKRFKITYRAFTHKDKRSCGCMKRPNLTGRTFGRLEVLERVEATDPRNNSKYGKHLVRCECGSEFLIRADKLQDGDPDTKACENCRKHPNKTHGLSKSRTYEIWSSMKKRCTNENNHAYDRYGGAGIAVCSRWMNSFEAFLEDMGEAPEGLTIDRIDGSKGYSPDNCRWATYQEQGENKRNNNWITIHVGTPQEETHTVTEWGRITGICHATISYRIRIMGWSAEKAVFTPVDPEISARSSVPKKQKRQKKQAS